MGSIIVNKDLGILKEKNLEFKRETSQLDFSNVPKKAVEEINIEINYIIESCDEALSRRHITDNSIHEILIQVPHSLTVLYNRLYDYGFMSNSSKLRTLVNELIDVVWGVVLFSSVFSSSGVKSELSEIRKKINSSDFSEKNEAKLREYITSEKVVKEVAEVIKPEIERTQNQNENKLLALRKKLGDELNRDKEEFSDSLVSDVEKALSETKSELESVRKKAKEYEVNFQKLYELMKGLYGVVGNGKLAEYNNKQANIEKVTADKLRFWGMVWLGLPLALTLTFLLHYIFGTDVKLNFEWALSRFLTISVASTLSIYMLKESASHRMKENLYRQRGTQLATIGAYLDDFPDPNEKMKVKKELIHNFYSFHDGRADTSNVPDPHAQIKEVIALSKSLSKITPIQAPPQSDNSIRYSPKPEDATGTAELQPNVNGNHTTPNGVNGKTP